MPRGRHAYVRFYPSDWKAGTARLSRELHSMYFDVCIHNWDRAEVMSKAEQALVFADVDGWKDKVQSLIDMDKLKRTQGGGLYCERAINEARSSNERYSISVASGRDGAAKRWNKKDNIDRPPNGVAVANQNQNQNHKEKEPIGSKSADIHQLPLKAKPKPKASSRATPCPWDRDVPNEQVQWAVTNMKWSKETAVRQGKRMIDHALAHDRRMVDWPATWRSWCRHDLQKAEPIRQTDFGI